MLKVILLDMIKENRAQYAARRQAIVDKAAKLNAGWAETKWNRDGFDAIVEPTWDADDKPHAPFDGYLWEDPRTGDINEFGGGQYLPYVDDFERMDQPEYTGDHGWWKLRLTTEMLEEIKGVPGIEMLPAYKQLEVPGITAFMMKVRADKRLLKAIQDYSKEFFDKLYANLRTTKGKAPSGRLEVTGKVISTKVIQDFYGAVAKCMIVLENGSTVYGTLPKCVPIEHRGSITFTARFDVARDDDTHAFYSRPTKVTYAA